MIDRVGGLSPVDKAPVNVFEVTRKQDVIENCAHLLIIIIFVVLVFNKDIFRA